MGQRTDVARPLFTTLVAGALLVLAVPSSARPRKPHPTKAYTSELAVEDCTFRDRGHARFFVLEPGHRLRLGGEVKEGWFEVTRTVLADTRVIDGVRTRVVEELETVDGELAELSLNFYAICEQTSAVYYFGEEVRTFVDGEPVSTNGSWEAGLDGARPGIAMPGTYYLGARYQMEMAPDVAMDRAENRDMGITVNTPAGTFEGCVEVVESTPLEPDERTVKLHAPGVGVVVDDGLELLDWSPAPGSEP